jgi:excisionase family DNA binding protein
LDTPIDRHTSFEHLPQFLTVNEVADFLDIGRSTAYALARENGVRFGRLLRVPRTRLETLRTIEQTEGRHV